MARVTVEDCEQKVQNKYELVLMAAKRARDIEKGSPLAVSRENDKSTILALREIAENAINIDGLRTITQAEIARDGFESALESVIKTEEDREDELQSSDFDDDDDEEEEEDSEDFDNLDSDFDDEEDDFEQ